VEFVDGINCNNQKAIDPVKSFGARPGHSKRLFDIKDIKIVFRHLFDGVNSHVILS